MYPRYDDATNMDLSDQIIIPSYFMQRWFDRPERNTMSSRLLAKLINTTNNTERIVSIGASHNNDKCVIYAPSWIISHLGCDELTPVRVLDLKEDETRLKPISKIIIKPLDNIIFNTDIMKCFTDALDRLQVIYEGMTLPMRIPEFGNYEMFAYIDKVEPEAVCLTCQGEVDVDFIRENDGISEIDDYCKPKWHVPDSTLRSVEVVETAEVVEQVKSSEDAPISLEERRRRIRESWAIAHPK